MPKGLALLLAGKLGHPSDEEGGGEEDMEPSKDDAKLDAMRHFIAAVHSKKEEDALQCLEDLIELCRDEEPSEEEDAEQEE